MLTRRFFIGGVLSSGIAGLPAFAQAGAAAKGDGLLKLGVLSDIHLRRAGDEAPFRRALEYFRSRQVDGVIVAGDIANDGAVSQLVLAAETWYSVFPDDRLPDGRRVERLFILGNHCVMNEIGRDRAAAWRMAFHEDYEPIWRKTVRGIPVIGAHWITGENIDDNGIEAYMREHGRELDPQLPFIYIQHGHPKDTCFGPWAWGHDDGRATRALSPFPNAIVFSGHSHYSLVDERTVWQGAFTSVNTGSMCYVSTDYALRENVTQNSHGYRGEKRPHRMPCLVTSDGKHGQVVTIGRDRMVIERRDFNANESLGDDIVVPLPARPTSPIAYAVRAARRSAPAFAAGAAVAVATIPAKDEKDFVRIELKFPAARAVDGCRVNEYEVTAVLVEDDVELVQAQRRMLSPDHYRPVSGLVKDVSFAFAQEDLPLRGRYRFAVRPIECFGKKGNKIVSSLTVI